MNLTILIAQTAIEKSNVQRMEWTTSYLRWTPPYRQYLFTNLCFVPVSSVPVLFSFAVPKLRDDLERGLLAKIVPQQRTTALLSPRRCRTRQQLSYRTAGGRYYKIFLDRALDSESKSNKTTSLREDVDVRAVLAVLSSNLWWWYYTLHFDMYNCKDYMIFGFPFSYPSNSDVINALSDTGASLVDDLFANAERKVQDYATTGMREQLIFKPSRSKPIIDRIDLILASHYNFSSEELDFLINYDIKYRMGGESDGEEGLA